MYLEDDKPDYFLADGPENDNASSAADGNAQGHGTIDFGPDASSASDNTSTNGEFSNSGSQHHRGRGVLIWIGIIAMATLGVAFYLRYCSPYVEDAVMRAYVVNVEKSGLIFKTYEAQVVEADALADTSKVYSHPLQMTIESERAAHILQQFQGQRHEVTLRYEKYYATLPWRGSSKWVITSVEP